jgi:formylglycine-generating enzyme required for sulfatase activity
LRGYQPQRRLRQFAVFAALSAAVLWLTALAHPSEAATRGLALEIKASEAPNAPTVETVNLYTRSYALVIGINDYGRGWQRLSKAVSDARRVAKALEKHGFEVTLRTDLKSDDLAATLKNFFIDRGRDPNARLFVWFAGHGATVDGEGYLIPSDGAALTDETGFLHNALSLRDFGKFARYAKSKHVFSVFDACFAGTIFNVARSRTPPAITRVTTEPVRQFLSSGDAGQEVSDNGEFASMFIEALEGRSRADANADGYLTGTEIGENLTYRMANVTNNRQTPRSGKLRSAKFDRGDFVFRLGGEVSTPSVSSVDRDALFWSSIKDSSDEADYQAYLDQYPDGGFAALARIRLKRLSVKVATVITVPKVKTPSPAKPVVGAYPDDPKPGTVFRDCPDCPEMVVIPPGEFMMGGTPAEHEWSKSYYYKKEIKWEKPRHKVTIKKNFAVGKFEVTRGQYNKFVSATGQGHGDFCYNYGGKNNKRSPKNWRSPGYVQTDEHPVACVSWDDATAYVEWLSTQTGVQYRLLSEAEFEYVSRANTTTMRFWGDDWENRNSCKYANVPDKSRTSRSFDCADGYKNTSPVGKYQANAFGVYDIMGNLAEWTEDCWNTSYSGAPDDGTSWTSGDCGGRVLRGGSWYGFPFTLRSAYRFMYSTVNRFNNLGFRVARTLSK